MTGPLARVLVHRPGPEMAEADPAEWHYAQPVDLPTVQAQHDAFTALLRAHGATVEELGGAPGLSDAVFPHDPSLTTPGGAVILRMGKRLREGEAALHRAFYEAADIPILGEIEAPGTVEGGDCLWLTPRMLAIGVGPRTNEAGVAQLEALLKPHDVVVTPVSLPDADPDGACLHLMSLVSLLAPDLALVHDDLLPFGFLRTLNMLGVTMIRAPEDEFEASATVSLNVLATAPRRAIMLDGWPKTRAVLETAGCEVDVFEGADLCIACEGGPTCLTRPLARG